MEKTPNPKQWFYMPLEWLQGWQFHQVYYLQFLRFIASAGGDGRRRGEFCHSNGRGTAARNLHHLDPVTGHKKGLRRSQMFVARAFLKDQGLIRLHKTRYGTKGALDLSAMEKMECVAVRADVLAQIRTPEDWIHIRLQILLAYETAKAEKARGHSAPAGRRPCLGVREFKAALAIVPHWRYLKPALHSPAALEAIFPPWQAAALRKVCTIPDSGGRVHAPETTAKGESPCTIPDTEAIGNGKVIQFQDSAAGQARPKVWRVPAPVLRHLRAELADFLQVEGITPAAIAPHAGLLMAAANFWHRFLAGRGAMASYRQAYTEAIGALYFCLEVSDRKTRGSLFNRLVDCMGRYQMGAYFDRWAAGVRLEEESRYLQGLKPDFSAAPLDLVGFITEELS